MPRLAQLGIDQHRFRNGRNPSLRIRNRTPREISLRLVALLLMFTCNESSYSPKRTLLTPQARISEQHLTVSNARMRRGSEIKPLTCSSSCLANVSFSTTDDNQWHCEGALMARRTTCYECFILWTWLTTTESRAALVGTSSCSRRRYLGETISCARSIVA